MTLSAIIQHRPEATIRVSPASGMMALGAVILGGVGVAIAMTAGRSWSMGARVGMMVGCPIGGLLLGSSIGRFVGRRADVEVEEAADEGEDRPADALDQVIARLAATETLAARQGIEIELSRMINEQTLPRIERAAGQQHARLLMRHCLAARYAKEPSEELAKEIGVALDPQPIEDQRMLSPHGEILRINSVEELRAAQPNPAVTVLSLGEFSGRRRLDVSNEDLRVFLAKFPQTTWLELWKPVAGGAPSKELARIIGQCRFLRRIDTNYPIDLPELALLTPELMHLGAWPDQSGDDRDLRSAFGRWNWLEEVAVTQMGPHGLTALCQSCPQLYSLEVMRPVEQGVRSALNLLVGHPNVTVVRWEGLPKEMEQQISVTGKPEKPGSLA
jgi:hypothetical protein